MLSGSSSVEAAITHRLHLSNTDIRVYQTSLFMNFDKVVLTGDDETRVLKSISL